MLGSRSVIHGTDLDHIAVAAEAWSDVRPRYVDELGGTWLGGGPDPGFAWAQVLYANRMRLEMLEPHEPEKNDFLRRFLDRNGPGPHHITFKVPSLVDALAEAEASGYRPVSVNMTHPDWKEAFLHPKDAPGIVIQLAQSTEKIETTPRAEAASLDRIVHAVADLDEGLRLFERLLGGGTIDKGDGYVELGWPGPGRVRLVSGDAYAAWLGDRAGRLHHLAFTVAGLNAEREIAPDDNFGVRLRLSPA